MSPTFSQGAPLSPDYGADDQGDLIWVPVRVPKGSPCSPSAHTQNFYQTPDQLAMQDVSMTSFLPPTTWGQDATMISTVGDFPGITASDPMMDWSCGEFAMGSGFDAILDLELQANVVNPQPELGDITNLFSGSEGSDMLYGFPDLGLGLRVPDAFSGPQLGSPVESAWGTLDNSYSGSSTGSCSPVPSMSPAIDSTFLVPEIAASPALFAPLDTSSSLPQPTTCRSRKHRPHQTTSTVQPRQRQRRASPTSPREGGASNSSSGNSFRCALCDKPHMDNRALSRHLWAQHPEYAARTKTKSERAQCPHCEYSGRADNLVRHMKRHGR